MASGPTGPARTRRLAAEGRPRRDRLGGTVHLGGAGALVVVAVTTAAVGRRRRLLEAERRIPPGAGTARAGAWTSGAGTAGTGATRPLSGRRRPRCGRCVRGRRVRQEVPPALLAEGRAALAGCAALRAEFRFGGEVRASTGTPRSPRSPRSAGSPGTARARRRGRGAGRRVSVTGARGRRWWRRGYGTGHTVTADLAPVVGTRLVSVRAGRHVGASPSPFRPHGRFLWPRRAGVAGSARIPGGGARLMCSGVSGFCLFAYSYFFTRTVLVDRVSRVISSASVTFAFSRTVPVAASTTSTTFASSFAVSAFPEALAS